MKLSLFRIAVIACLPLFAFMLPTAVTGQVTGKFYQVEKTYVRKLGHTRPLREVLPRTPTDALKLADYKANKPEYVRNFIGRRRTEHTAEHALPRGVDPLLNGGQQRDGGIVIEPVINIEGLSVDDVTVGVPDPNGDVSDQNFIQVVNQTWLQVYDLQGNKVGNRFHANTIWQQVGFTSSGDPIILFDKAADRWFLTEFPPSSRVLMAVSDTEDPFGAWTAYAFSTPSFPDYPKYGIWPEAYVLTTNESGFEGTLKFYAINRNDILDGKDTVGMQRFTIPRLPDPSFQVATPVTWIGTMMPPNDMKPMIMRINDDGWGGTVEDRIELYEMDLDWDDENNSAIIEHNIPTTPFDAEFCSESGFGFTCVPQPNGVGIDGIPWVIMHKAQYRRFDTHNSLVINFTVDASGDDDGGIRWMELRKVENEDWWIYQEGTYGTDDDENRFMGGISIDSKGNIGLGFNVSSETTFPSIRFTGRRASDPLGQMTVREYECATGTGAVSGDRFGDYGSMTVDAQDMFWYTSEYVKDGGEWASKIVGFKLDRSMVDIGPTALLSPANSPGLDTENVSVAITNHGELPQTDFLVGYMFEGGDPVIDTISIAPLMTDSNYLHTFDETIQFGPFDNYSLVVFTVLETDSIKVNDTCYFTVVKQTQFDASVSTIDGLPQVICDTIAEFNVVIENIGANPLTSATLYWSVNDGPASAYGWSGSLAMGESEIVPVIVTPLAPGYNELRFYTSDPNALPDQNTMNDTLAVNVIATPGGEKVVLNLLTDLFPEETSWQLRDSNETILFEAGPLVQQTELHSEEWCLDSDQCYKFVLYDSFGDGIQAYGVEGDFEIVNDEGFAIASLSEADFGDSLVTEFCLDFTCTLTANAFLAHESEPGANDGLISVSSFGGSAPLMFSINGLPFQSSSVFNGLPPGDYTITVVDDAGCSTELMVTIQPCNTQIMTHVTNASGPGISDGSILISTEGASGNVQYSINDGANFQADPLFENLLPDTFYIVIKDAIGCEVKDTVIVDFSSSIATTSYGQLIKVFPNPSAGAFYFEVEGLQGDLFVQFEVIDLQGKVIQRGEAGNFSGMIRGAFSLYSAPAGIYYLRFRHHQLNRLVRVVKQ